MASSEQWQAYHIKKQQITDQQEKDKEERKLIREERKNMKLREPKSKKESI